MNTTTQTREQINFCNLAGSRLSRLYRSVVWARDELGMTRDEFKRNCDRRPGHYGPVAYLADCDSFWNDAE
jgi:hypothetical protein